MPQDKIINVSTQNILFTNLHFLGFYYGVLLPILMFAWFVIVIHEFLVCSVLQKKILQALYIIWFSSII